jgi:hypothetical protein
MEAPAKKRLPMLKAVAGACGHRVIPGTGLSTNGRYPSVPKIGSKAKSPSVSKSYKTAEQRKIESEIKEVNSKIKERSKRSGKKLDAEDPLLLERNCLFRDLQGLKTGVKSPEP